MTPIARAICVITALVSSLSSLAAAVQDPADAVRGAKVLADNCARCHEAPDPASRSRSQWSAIAQHMRIFSDISQDDQRRVVAFLRMVNTAKVTREAGSPASVSAAAPAAVAPAPVSSTGVSPGESSQAKVADPHPVTPPAPR